MSTSQSLVTTLKGTNVELDFHKIKKNLKDFLSAQDQFVDYNFEASGISILLDVLAYNTQMNAMTAHLALNELFLDSAQARPNVVSLAKQLGYLTRSVGSATATINLTVVPPFSYTSTSLTIPADIMFSGGGLSWYTASTYTSTKNGNGNFYFSNVILREGRRKVVRYYYDVRRSYPKFEIPDRDVDTSTIKVRVKETEKSTIYTTYRPFTYFSAIDDTTPVYFMEENALGLYEVYFTGGDIGISPSEGNIIEIEYIYSNGAAANGISVFKTDYIFTKAGESQIVRATASATGGRDKESADSIRFNAPYYFEAQNRCVSFNDYAAVIRREIPQVESINVWGGESNVPAEFGRVYIAIKPAGGLVIDNALKQYIINSVLRPKAVATISPRIIDAEYTYIGLDIESRYNPANTTNSSQAIADIIKNATIAFSNKYLNVFEGPFRYSKFLAAIDNSEVSIENTIARVYLIKKIFAYANQENEFFLTVPTEFYDFDADDAIIRSSIFRLNNISHYLIDQKDETDPNRRQLVLMFISTEGDQVVQDVDVGYIDLIGKIVYIYGFRPDTDTAISIYVNPKSYDIVPIRNQIISVDPNEVTVSVLSDYIETNIYPGTVRANATPRNITKFERG